MTVTASFSTWLTGYIADVPTPFDADGAVDLATFNVINAVLASG